MLQRYYDRVLKERVAHGASEMGQGYKRVGKSEMRMGCKGAGKSEVGQGCKGVGKSEMGMGCKTVSTCIFIGKSCYSVSTIVY